MTLENQLSPRRGQTFMKLIKHQRSALSRNLLVLEELGPRAFASIVFVETMEVDYLCIVRAFDFRVPRICCKPSQIIERLYMKILQVVPTRRL